VADTLGTFEQAVLLALARPKTAFGKEAYGRAVLKEVELRLDREISAGAVYATLDRLEKKGFISSEVREGDEKRGGLQRRCYFIEPDGIQALNDAKKVMDRLWAGMTWPIKGTL
jgi:DNA-binding PadR family transcriptional regulator